MNRYKKILAVCSVAAMVMATGVGATLAYFTDTDKSSNVITTGHVSGTLTETGESERNDGSKGLDFVDVKPGLPYDKDPTVTLDADSEKAYARVKIVYEGLSEEQISDLEDELDIQPDWNKSADGYYYYNKILEPNASTKVFTKITIPAKWGNEIANKKFSMDIVAELIQAEGFTPVKTNDKISSWGEVDIQEYEAPAEAPTETPTEAPAV